MHGFRTEEVCKNRRTIGMVIHCLADPCIFTFLQTNFFNKTVDQIKIIWSYSSCRLHIEAFSKLKARASMSATKSLPHTVLGKTSLLPFCHTGSLVVRNARVNCKKAHNPSIVWSTKIKIPREDCYLCITYLPLALVIRQEQPIEVEYQTEERGGTQHPRALLPQYKVANSTRIVNFTQGKHPCRARQIEIN